MEGRKSPRPRKQSLTPPPLPAALHLTGPLSPQACSPRPGPALARAVASAARDSKSEATPSRSTHSVTNAAKGNHVLRDGNSDEIEDSAMNISTMVDTLRSGDDDQITLILFETQQVLEVCRQDAVQMLVPAICQEVLEWEASLQISAAEAVTAVVSSSVPPDVAKNITDTAFHIIRKASDPYVCETWGQILVSTLPNVSWSAKEVDEVVNQLETQHGSQGLLVSRQLTARILGSLAMCSKNEDSKKRIMYRAMLFTNDKDIEVRGMVAESLSFIGASIKISVVEEELWPFIAKLVKDENARVHAAALRTLSFIAAAHRTKSPRSKLYRHHIPSIITGECARIRKAAEEDQRTVDDDTYLILEVNSEIFGELLNCCWDFLPDDLTRKEAFKAFLAMATCNGPIVRKYCAFSLPVLSMCFVKRHRVEVSSLVEFMSRDSEAETRWVLASGLHEIIKILADRDTISNLFQTVLALLRDANPLVRMRTLRHFEELIAQLTRHLGYNSVHKLEPIFQNIDLLSEGNWRTQELLSKQLLLAAPLVPPPSIVSNVLPLLYKLAEGSSYLVRKAAMAAVAICMRYIPDTTEREKAMASFRLEWGKGSVYWMRIGFIDSAKAALDSYSRCLFRDTFATGLLRLSYDPVPNVRIRLAMLLPLVAPACHQMVEFHNALERLKKDDDRDVQDITNEIDGKIAHSLEMRQESFEDDMKREEEEQDLYSRHLQAQKEAFRKKRGNITRARTMFMKKPVRQAAQIPRHTPPALFEPRSDKENSAVQLANSVTSTSKTRIDTPKSWIKSKPFRGMKYITTTSGTSEDENSEASPAAAGPSKTSKSPLSAHRFGESPRRAASFVGRRSRTSS